MTSSLFSTDLRTLAQTVLDRARARGVMLTTAESCTGGLIAGLLTDLPGASDVVDRGFVTYSNAAKQEMLEVPAELLSSMGAVSGPVASAMAEGALAASKADLAVSVTGVAGPGGGTAAKPVGLVWFGLARTGAATVADYRRFGDIGRTAIRLASVQVALEMLSRP